MSFGDLSNALTTLTVLLDGDAVQYQWSSADSLTFETGTPHAGAHTLDDQAAFKLSDGADDDDDGPAQRATSVDIFSERDVLDPYSIHLIQNIEEVLHRPGDPVRCPDEHNIESAAAGIVIIWSRPGRLAFVPLILSLYSWTIS